MSFVLVAPEMLATAAASAGQIGSAVREAHLTAVIPTTALEAAGADEVSATIAALFGAHAEDYQAVAARAVTQYEQFVRNLGAAAASYAGAEAAIATSLQEATSPLLPSAAGAGTGFQTFVQTAIRAFGDTWIGSGQTPASGGSGTQSIVIDFIRHGQSEANLANLMTSAVPGPALTALGQSQATAIGNTLFAQGPFAGIFTSQLLRTQMTAAPLLSHYPLMTAPELAGLNEISVGDFEGLSGSSVQSFLWKVGPIAWWLGLPIVPVLAPGANINGVTFFQGFNSALQSMYSGAMMNPVLSADGNITDVAFSSQFTIEIGTQMTVKNPDPLLMFTHQLGNTAEVVVQGNPQDGWTLVSWDGVAVQQHSLPLELIGTTRDLVMAPSFAANTILQSFGTGDPRTISSAIGTGVGQMVTATLDFPIGVVEDVVDAVSNLPPL